MTDVSIDEPALLIRIAKLYSPKLSAQQLYEATRGVWRIGPRREAAKFALCVAKGEVIEVYEISAWHSAGSTPYATRPRTDVEVPGRWEFTGKLAPPAIREKYVGKSVAHYFPQGHISPVTYVNA